MNSGEERFIRMPIFYFDTSAIVKRYYREAGSDVLDKIFELKERSFAVSFWAVLEFVVALSAKMRRKEISQEAFNAAISRFLKDLLDMFTIIEVSNELVAGAIPLAVKYSLPSSDCLQLASVLHLERILVPMGEKVVFICADKDLCRASEREGINCIDPEEKDALEKLRKTL